MRFEKIIPTVQLRPYIKYFVLSEMAAETQYKVFPSSGLVIGFQYRGQLALVNGTSRIKLSTAGVTGISDSYKTFSNSANIATVLVYFTEVGFAHFAPHPANELFNESIALQEIFDKNKVAETEEKLAVAQTDQQRIQLIENLMFAQLKEIQIDRLIVEAVKIIYETKGTIRIKALIEKLYISQSPFEKRFRKLVGTSPKKFASIVRFNTVLDKLDGSKSLSEICYENNFFDQAHFIKDFKRFTGDTPDNFKRLG